MKPHRIPVWLIPALLSVSGMVTSASARTPPPPAVSATPVIDAAGRKTVLESAIAQISAHYVFPDKVPAIARMLRRNMSAGDYDAIHDPDAFAKAVNADIAPVAQDRHLRLFWSAEPLPILDDKGEPDAAEIARRQARNARVNYLIPRAEILAGNIGYLKIDGFLAAEDAGPTLAAAMAFLRHSDALIFDVRDNGGGDPGTVALAVSYLLPPETELNRFHQRGEAVDVQSWSLPYVPGGRWSIDKPVYVLTSKRTASGGEEFAYDIQQRKRGTIIGEPTWGGANPGDIMPIDEHFYMFVPTGAAVNPVSKTNWEGVGVTPDVAVDPRTALETARHMALQRLSERATGEERLQLEKLLAMPPVPESTSK